jgi:hypothetical protein
VAEVFPPELFPPEDLPFPPAIVTMFVFLVDRLQRGVSKLEYRSLVGLDLAEVYGGCWRAVADGRLMMIRAVVGGCEMLCDRVEVFGDNGFGWMEFCPARRRAVRRHRGGPWLDSGVKIDKAQKCWVLAL